MDLAIGDTVVERIMPFSRTVIDPYDQESINRVFKEPVKFDVYHMEAFSSVLMHSAATISVFPEFEALIQLRSTWARLGLISPPTVVDPGFNGQLTFELYNPTWNVVLFRPGDLVWSMHTYPIPHRPARYDGRYQWQTGVTLPKAMVSA